MIIWQVFKNLGLALTYKNMSRCFFCTKFYFHRCGEKYKDFHTSAGEKQRCLLYNQIINSEVLKGGQNMTQEELEFRRRCPYDAFGDYSDVLKEIRQKEKENKTDTVSVVNRSK